MKWILELGDNYSIWLIQKLYTSIQQGPYVESGLVSAPKVSCGVLSVERRMELLYDVVMTSLFVQR